MGYVAGANRAELVAPFVVYQPPWLVAPDGIAAAPAHYLVPWKDRKTLFFTGHMPKPYLYSPLRFHLWRQLVHEPRSRVSVFSSDVHLLAPLSLCPKPGSKQHADDHDSSAALARMGGYLRRRCESFYCLTHPEAAKHRLPTDAAPPHCDVRRMLSDPSINVSAACAKESYHGKSLSLSWVGILSRCECARCGHACLIHALHRCACTCLRVARHVSSLCRDPCHPHTPGSRVSSAPADCHKHEVRSLNLSAELLAADDDALAPVRFTLEEYLRQAFAHKFCLVSHGDDVTTHKLAESIAIAALGGCLPLIVHPGPNSVHMPYVEHIDCAHASP